MKFSTIAIPALMGLASAQDITLGEKRDIQLDADDLKILSTLQRRDAAVGPGALALIGGAAYPVANWLLEKVAGPAKTGKRSIDLNDDDIEFLQGLQSLQSLQARDAAVGPGALALIGGAAYPVANWILEKVAGPGKQAAKRSIDLNDDDIEFLQGLQSLQSLQARDAAVGPVALAIGGGAFGAGVNWLMQRISPSSKRSIDLNDDDIEFLQGLQSLQSLQARDAAVGPVALAIGGGAFGAGVNWLMQRISPSSKRSIGEFAPMVRRDNLVFKPVQFAA